MSKTKFIEAIDKLLTQNTINEEAYQYYVETIKAKKVNKKEVEKATIVKEAIYNYLVENKGKFYDRTEIGNELYNRAEFAEEFLVNEKGTIAYNSITAFANQLANDGKIRKDEIKVGKVKKIKYSAE